jgi:hypothetical protein
MTLASLLALWRRELSDAKTTLYPNGKRFTDAHLIEWANQARLLIYKYRPQWYQKTVVLKLSAGSLQNTCDCNMFYAIDGLSDKDGNVLAPLTKQNSKSANFFAPAPCNPCVGGSSTAAPSIVTIPITGVPQTYQFDPNIPGRFTVIPAVPAIGDYYVRAVCANPPKACCDAADPSCCFSMEEYPVIQWYVKAMAESMQKQSLNSQGLAREYMGTFYKMLGVSKMAEKEYLQQKAA